MRRSFYAVAVLLLMLGAVPSFAMVQSRNIVDDVIKMSKSGVADETILDFVQKAGRYDVTADDVVAMSEANVPRNVIRAVVQNAETSSPSRRDAVRDRTTVVVAPTVERYGYYPYYSYYPYYDPFWYGPTFSFGFGFGHNFGGHHGHWGGGHGHWGHR